MKLKRSIRLSGRTCRICLRRRHDFGGCDY
jgi:hypothetical protein